MAALYSDLGEYIKEADREWVAFADDEEQAFRLVQDLMGPQERRHPIGQIPANTG